jgi:hypothetical protein
MKAQLDRRILLILCTLLLLSTACAISDQILTLLNPAKPAGPTAIAVAETGEGTVVSAVGATTTLKPPPAAPTATDTPRPTLRPSSTPYPTPTIAHLSASQYLCDSSAFVKDVTIPDGTTIPAGAIFEKTWQIRNTGRCTWSTEYSVVNVKGETLSYRFVGMDSSVASGGTTDVTVSMRAPSSAGSYRSYFQLQNKRGTVFGSKFYVDFKVVVQPTNSPDLNVKYEFATSYCSAAWIGNSISIPCPSTEGSNNGWMKVIAAPVLETGYIDNEPGLLMVPPATATTTDSVIYARYPAYTVQAGDHFATIIGCDRGATDCNVKFEIKYQIGTAALVTLGNGPWTESYDNSINNIDISLSPLVGQSVTFYLFVYSNGGSSGDRALWLRPRILNN